jgi:hypothetical protein
MLFNSKRLTAANIKGESLSGLGSGVRKGAAKSFAAAGNKLFKNNGETVKGLGKKISKFNKR